MKCLVYRLEAPGQLRLIEEELNSNVLGPQQLQAKTIYTAISPGTELAAWKGMPPLRPSTVYPRLMGYCNLAEVTHVGSDLKNIKPGDLILTHQSHRTHFQCQEADVLLKVDRDLPEQKKKNLTAVYLYHLGYSALLAGKYFPGHVVGIIGVGTLGRTTASLVRTFGGEPCIYTNQSEVRAQLRSNGFEFVFDKTKEGLAADITINTSNNWSDHELAMKTTRFGGCVVCLGFPGRGQEQSTSNPLDSRYFYDKQLTIKHSGIVNGDGIDMNQTRFNLKANLEYLSSLINQGRLDPSEIINGEYSAKELDQAYKALSDRQSNVFSLLLNWSEM